MTDKQSPWRSPWVITWVVLLITFIAVSGYRIFLAIDTNPGLVDENYYERGRSYEKERLKRMARDPGWKMRIEAPEFVDIAKPTGFGFVVTDKQGSPMTPDSVTFYVYRPSDAKRDFSLPMVKVADGRYQAEASFPLLGVWDILVSVKNGEDEYNLAHRISAGVK
ncbi:MAG: FixH family protein [Gammaproteobacteria bacterium]|nr:FixH family protein [Gammaproteobacteria bacterium]